jgi:hypothetical protein
MPGFAFPLVGRLGLTSPPSSVLCSATTAICPSRFPVLSLVHRYLVTTPRSLCPFFKLASGRSSPLHARAIWSTGSPLSSGFALQETNGSPKSPDYPCECMPRSSTPVVSSVLALAYSGLLPSTRMTVSAFPSKRTDGYPVSTTIQISRLNHAACILAPPGFGRPLLGLPARFTTSLLARL